MPTDEYLPLPKHSWTSPSASSLQTTPVKEEELEAYIAGLLDEEPATPEVTRPEHGPATDDQKSTPYGGASPSYSFAPTEVRAAWRTADGAVLIDALSKLWRLHERKGVAVDDDTFAKFRRSVVELNLALNRHGYISPRFRPMRKRLMLQAGTNRKAPSPSNNAVNDPREQDLSRDRMVIDLHWVWHQQRRELGASDATPVSWERTTDDFNFDGAVEMATRAWSAESKLKELGIDAGMEWQLAVIQHDDTRERWKALQADAKSLERHLGGLARRETRLKNKASTWVQTWMAHQIAVEAAGGGAMLARQFVGHMTGSEPKDAGNFRKHLRAVMKRVDPLMAKVAADRAAKKAKFAKR